VGGGYSGSTASTAARSGMNKYAPSRPTTPYGVKADVAAILGGTRAVSSAAGTTFAAPNTCGHVPQPAATSHTGRRGSNVTTTSTTTPAAVSGVFPASTGDGGGGGSAARLQSAALQRLLARGAVHATPTLDKYVRNGGEDGSSVSDDCWSGSGSDNSSEAGDVGAADDEFTRRPLQHSASQRGRLVAIQPEALTAAADRALRRLSADRDGGSDDGTGNRADARGLHAARPPWMVAHHHQRDAHRKAATHGEQGRTAVSGAFFEAAASAHSDEGRVSSGAAGGYSWGNSHAIPHWLQAAQRSHTFADVAAPDFGYAATYYDQPPRMRAATAASAVHPVPVTLERRGHSTS
jgi:hypothetical protein